MGIYSNTVSICHFRVLGELTSGADLCDVAADLLRQNHFHPIDETTDELSTGWVHLDDPKAIDFPVTACWRDRYLTFSMRRDQRKVPTALLKEQTEKACGSWLNENPGFTRVPKQKKEEIKEAVRLRLLAKALPDPKTYDVVWDTQSGILTFSTLSAKTIELLEDLFKRTFEGLRLAVFHPYERAMSLLAGDNQRHLRGLNRAGSENYLELIKENVWIGCDFAAWLLYQTMNGNAEYSVAAPGPGLFGVPFIAYINDKVVLCGAGENGTQMITVNGPQDRFAEVVSAMRGQKKITESTIHFETQDGNFTLTLKGEMFHFASFSTPAVKIEKDTTVDEAMEREAIFFERMSLLELGLQHFNSLFAAFLDVRLHSWPVAEVAILEWLEAA